MLWPRGLLQPQCFHNFSVHWHAARYWDGKGSACSGEVRQGACPCPWESEEHRLPSAQTHLFWPEDKALSVCGVASTTALVFFGKGLRKMMLCLWTWLALKREHPSFPKWPSPPHTPFFLFCFVFFYFVSSGAPKCFFFLRLCENELRISFGLVPKLKMKSLFHLAYIYSKDSCASAVQEQHEECIGWSSSGILQCYTAI